MNYRQKPVAFRIVIYRAAINIMLRLENNACPDRVVMNVVKFLQRNLLPGKQNRMIVLLPELLICIV